MQFLEVVFRLPHSTEFVEGVCRHDEAQALTYGHGQPHTVDAQQPGQNEDRHDHEHDGSGEREDSRGAVIVQGSKPAGREDVERHQDEADRR